MSSENNKISKIKLGDSIYDIGANWENISDKPELTREEIIDILENLYPESSSSEIEDMADDLLENYDSVTEALIEGIFSSGSSGGGGTSGGASLDSPAFTGTPTAPTAPYGTNTTQIATTAFVQQAVKPTIIISTTDIPSNIVATVTITLNSSDITYSLTENLNISGVTVFNLEYLGEYFVSFSNPQIQGSSSVNASLAKVYNYNAYWSDIVTYTLNIDTTNANTATACTYADDALEMTKGSSAWDLKPIFRQIRPCLFKDGQVNYYLNPDNWNQKLGTNEASDLTGEDGDVMIEFPKFAYKIKTENNVITVSVSTDPEVIENDSDYTYDAFSRLEEGDLNFFYKGAFNGWIDGNGKLRSLPGVKPTAQKTIAQFRTAAQSNGAHYQQSTYAQIKAIQCLFLIKYGDRNSQSVVGRGVVEASESYVCGYNTNNVNNISSENSTLQSGMTFGTTENGTTHMRLFGIEDLWGNIYDWVDGLTIDSARNYVYSWNSFSNEGVTPTYSTVANGYSSNSDGYITRVVGDSSIGFMPSTVFGGSTTTSWADYVYANGSTVLRYGGSWGDGDKAGIFMSDCKRNTSTADNYNGARLSYV